MSRVALIAVLLGVLVQSAVLDLTIYACTMDGRAGLECCCDRDSTGSPDASLALVDVDARCCDVHDASIEAQTFRAPSTDVLAPPLVAVVMDEFAVMDGATRFDAVASARGPPGPDAPIYIQTCALLI